MKRVTFLVVLLAVLGCFPTTQQVPKQSFGVKLIEPSSNLDLSYNGECYKIAFLPIYRQSEGIEFTIWNKSQSAICILWDECAIIDINGTTLRVMHNGIPYVDRNAPQVPSVIPPGASLRDATIPIANIFYYGNRWRVKQLFYRYYGTNLNGKTFGLFLTMMIGNEKKSQRFLFEIFQDDN